MFKGGYWGRILHVDLTTKSFFVEELSEERVRKFLGGAGFVISTLYDLIKPGIDALSPDNVLALFPGSFTGTLAPCASRIAFGAKSPLTGTIGVGLSGGYFPAELKFAGYDGMVITGRADKPTYIVVRDDTVSFRSAGRIWGVSTSDAQVMIKQDLKDQGVRVACIGPAGERLSRIACIINERRAVGRRGLGAVMGSKNLKAIVVRGNREVPVADPEAFKKARDNMAKIMKDSPVLYPEFAKLGTPMVADHLAALGIMPTDNWARTGTRAVEKTIGVAEQEKIHIGKEHCYGCPVGCTQQLLVRKGPRAGIMGEPEFESVYSLGTATGMTDPGEIAASDRLCDELGLDAISAGVAVAFAMELAEKGLLPPELAGELDLSFGNADTQYELIRRMAFGQEGLGQLLGDGVRAAAEKIGGDAWKYAMHVKGLELPGYDVRGAWAHGLNMATAYTGADHNKGYAIQEIFGIPVPQAYERMTAEGKGKLTKWNQDLRCVSGDCATMCGFLIDMALAGGAARNTADIATALTGITFTEADIWTIGERVNNLAKAFNVREGFTRADDTLPWRVMNEPLPDGLSRGGIIDRETLDGMLDEYYLARGWDPATSKPTRERLVSLGLDKVADDLGV